MLKINSYTIIKIHSNDVKVVRVRSILAFEDALHTYRLLDVQRMAFRTTQLLSQQVHIQTGSQ